MSPRPKTYRRVIGGLLGSQNDGVLTSVNIIKQQSAEAMDWPSKGIRKICELQIYHHLSTCICYIMAKACTKWRFRLGPPTKITLKNNDLTPLNHGGIPRVLGRSKPLRQSLQT
jgi:hypothetical protein